MECREIRDSAFILYIPSKEWHVNSVHGLSYIERVEQIRKKSCGKNQSGTKADVLFPTIQRLGHSNLDTGRMGGLYLTEL